MREPWTNVTSRENTIISAHWLCYCAIVSTLWSWIWKKRKVVDAYSCKFSTQFTQCWWLHCGFGMRASKNIIVIDIKIIIIISKFKAKMSTFSAQINAIVGRGPPLRHALRLDHTQLEVMNGYSRILYGCQLLPSSVATLSCYLLY